MNNIEEYNLKWLEYIRNVDLKRVSVCPNGHTLLAYPSVTPDGFKDGHIVICCPYGGIGEGINICDYYDYHTFRVPTHTIISNMIKRLK